MGLNKNLDEVRGRILGTERLPSIREVFSEVRREKSRKKVMLGESSTAAPITDNLSALAVRGAQNANYNNRQKKGRPWCDHCQKTGHIRETCWKLHGKPADWKPSRLAVDIDSRGNHVAVEEGNSTSMKSNPFNKEQLETLQKMFSQAVTTQGNIGTRSLAHKR